MTGVLASFGGPSPSPWPRKTPVSDRSGAGRRWDSNQAGHMQGPGGPGCGMAGFEGV